MNKQKITQLALVLILSSYVACKPKKAVEATPGISKTEAPAVSTACTDTEVTYTSTVKAIIDKNCAGSCHSASNHAGGIDLSTYENVKTEAIKARFIGSLKHEGYYTPMPKKNPKLNDSTLNILSCWIEKGCK